MNKLKSPVGWRSEAPLTVRAVWGSIPRPVKSETVWPPLRRFSGALSSRRQAAKMNPATRHSFRRDAASVMKIGFFYLNFLIRDAVSENLRKPGPCLNNGKFYFHSH